MGYDFRDFIELFRERGELVEVNEEVDWVLELSAFAAMTQRVRGPVLLFNNIKGLPERRAVVGYFNGTLHRPFRRIAMCMGVDPDLQWQEANYQIMGKMATPLKPVEVATGPCKEVVKMGKDANIFDFPIVYGGQGDCGRYLMTQITIVKDPDSDWTNWGNYATLAATRNRLATCASTATNLYALYRLKYEARGLSMPIAIAMGGDPVNYLLAGTPLPAGVSEADVAGGLRGVPQELVKCETSDILVPADAEIVFEGEVRPYERILEGPKTEAYNFTVGPRTPAPLIRIHCVTHRKNPILPYMFWVGYGMSSLHAQLLTMFAAGLNATMMMMGVPVKQVLFPTTKWAGYTFAFAAKKWYPGFIRDTMDKIRMFPPTDSYSDQVDAVDDDVNIYRMEELIDAYNTQSNPARDWWPSSPSWHGRSSGHLVSTLAYVEREDLASQYGEMTVPTGFWYRDNTTKGEPPLGVRRMMFESLIPEETQKWVMDNWQKWGFVEEPFWDKSWLDLKPSLV